MTTVYNGNKVSALSQTIDITALLCASWKTSHTGTLFQNGNTAFIFPGHDQRVFFTTINMTLRKNSSQLFLSDNLQRIYCYLLLFHCCNSSECENDIIAHIYIVYLLNVYQRFYYLYLGRISENYPLVHKNTMKMLSTRWI